MIENMSKYWTGVGSRKTPDDILRLMKLIGKVLTDLGWVLRSGAAEGADAAFYAGCQQSSEFGRYTPYIYLAWDGVGGHHHDPEMGLYVGPNFWTWEKAGEIALEVRGSWEGLGRGGIAMHTRNVYQVLGHGLNAPSKFLICWAPPVGTKGRVKGGTSTAVKLAMDNNIDIINMATVVGYNRCIDLLDKYEVDHGCEKQS